MQAFSWFITIEILGLLALPVTCTLFKRLPDRGYAFGKALSILVITFILWLAVWAHILPNSRWSIFLIIVILAAGSIFLFWRRRHEIKSFISENRRIIIITEALFLLAFVFWTIVRAYNPDILFGEKYMDIAFINSILRSDGFPPYDPWISGYNMGYYYYFGYLIVGTLTKLTGIASAVTFNLSIALIFALIVIGAFSIVYNLVRLMNGGFKAALGFGLVGAGFIAIVSNLECVLELMHSHNFQSARFWEWVDVGNLNGPGGANPPYSSPEWYPTDWYWWWRESRTIGTAGLDYSINEFPFWSLFFADLHPHLIAIPFVLLNLAIGIELFLSPVFLGLVWVKKNWGKLIIFGICLGSLIFLNSWDLPTYALLLVVLIAIGGYFGRRKLDPRNFSYDKWAYPLAIFLVIELVFLALFVLLLGGIIWAIPATAISLAITGVLVYLWWRRRDIKGFIYNHSTLTTAVNVVAVCFALLGLALLLYLPHTWGAISSFAHFQETVGTGKAIALGLVPYYATSTRLLHFFLFWGVFSFIGVSFILAQVWHTLRGRHLVRWGVIAAFVVSLLPLLIGENKGFDHFSVYVIEWLLFLALVGFILTLLITAIIKKDVGRWQVLIAVLIPLLPLIFWAFTVNWDLVQHWTVASPHFFSHFLDRFGHILPLLTILSLILFLLIRKLRAIKESDNGVEKVPVFALFLLFVGFLLIMGCEVFDIEAQSGGMYERVTTVFKLYLQAWVFLGIGSALSLYWLARRWQLFTTPQAVSAIIGAASYTARPFKKLYSRLLKTRAPRIASAMVDVKSKISTRFSEPNRTWAFLVIGLAFMLLAVVIAMSAPGNPYVIATMALMFVVGAVLFFIDTKSIHRKQLVKRDTEVRPQVQAAQRGFAAFAARASKISSACTKPLWWTICILLIGASCVFPIAGLTYKTNEFSGNPTLNGMAWVKRDYPADYEAILWLNENVDDAPVITEAVGSHYYGYFWVSAYTGLPTIVGRWGQVPTWVVKMPPEEASDREKAAAVVYNTSVSSSIEEVQGVLDRYDVIYVYVGQREREIYKTDLRQNFSDFMDVAFANEGVTIYRVR